MTNKAYNIFCVIVGIITCFVLYNLFIQWNVGSFFVEPPAPDVDGNVSVASLQANDLLAGGFELILSVLIAIGGTVISIVTGALKSLGFSLGLSGYWEEAETEVVVQESNDDSDMIVTLKRAIKDKNMRLTIAICEAMAGDNYFTRIKDGDKE